MQEITHVTYEVENEVFTSRKEAKEFEAFLRVPYTVISEHLDFRDKACKWDKSREYRIIFDRCIAFRQEYRHFKMSIGNHFDLDSLGD